MNSNIEVKNLTQDMATTQAPHDPALAHVPVPPNAQPPQPGMPTSAPADMGNLGLAGLNPEQVVAILKQLPNFRQELNRDSASAAAETLSTLSQGSYAAAPHLQHPHQHPAYHHGMHPQQHPHQHPGMPNEPGPSSHPRGPPNLGQLSAAASALQNPQVPQPAQSAMRSSQERQDGDDGGMHDGTTDGEQNGQDQNGSPSAKPSGGRRGGRSATMSNDEWTRQRKDNHKEVERRRRGNINEGITELGRIVPNGSGEKAKGAILSRAVQYIHHLKENEARNIEKWTLEKLLMDQAMGDLQAQLEDMRKLWEEERTSRVRLQAEVEALRNARDGNLPSAAAVAAVVTANAGPPPPVSQAALQPPAEEARKSPDNASAKENGKREREEGDVQAQVSNSAEDAEERAKRQRVE